MSRALLHSAVVIFLVVSAVIGLPGRLHAQGAASSMVTDSVTGHVLQATNPRRKRQIGSLTKIAMAMVVLDWLELRKGDASQLATVPGGAAGIEAANPLGLQPGDRLSLRDLLYAALLQSDNVAAFTLAEHVGQTLPAESKIAPVTRFVAQMNALARRLRMNDTLFVNPHGLDASERKLPYSTAADLAKLSAYAMAKSAFRFYVSQKDRRIAIQHAAGDQSEYLLQNTNELLGVDGIDGVKTGTTRRAGECLVVSASRPPESIQQGGKYFITPRRLIVVVLGSGARFQVATSLVRSGWGAYEQWTAAGRPPARGER